MKYSVNLKKTGIESYEKHRDNFMRVTIQAKSNHTNLSKKCYTKMFMSKNAMLGFGKSLIRYAHDKRVTGHHWHFDPIRPNESLVLTLGIYILPNSIEPIVGSNDDSYPIEGHTENTTPYENNIDAYNFPINRKYETIEDFEKNDDNLVLFRVFDVRNNDISDQCQYILLWLNTNAMLGLGTELIRLAHNFEEGKSVTIEPSTEKEAKQSMGIFLTTDSCPLTIVCKSFEPIEKYLEKYEQEHDN